MNRVRSKDAGYTIVETMAFLAVSGALFVSTMLLLNGQQRKTEFSTTVRELDTKLQSVIGNVSAGYYNNPGSVTCTLSSGILNITDIPSSQGQNQDCIYIGQVIIPTTSGDGLYIYSVAGLRLNSSGQEVKDFYEAKPKLITVTVETYKFPSGITVPSPNGMTVDGTAFGSLGIFSTFNQYGAGLNPLLKSGSTKSNFYTLTGITALEIQNELISKPSPEQGEIRICLTDGSRVGVIKLNTSTTRVTIGKACS